MRTFPATVETALSQDKTTFFIFVDLVLDGTTLRLTTAPSDVTVNGQVYLANGLILDYDAPNYSSVVDREAYRISFADPGQSSVLSAKLMNNVIGSDMIIRVGFEESLLTTNPLSIAEEDLIYAYTGYIDSPQISNDFGTKYISLEGTSPMADLDMTKEYTTTPAIAKQYDSTDTCFDRIFEGYDLQIKWGKI